MLVYGVCVGSSPTDNLITLMRGIILTMEKIKKKCIMCKTKYPHMEYKIYSKDGEMYCGVCITDLAESYTEDWLEKNFREVARD